MVNIQIEAAKKCNYYGLQSGDLCFIDHSRQEEGIFYIYSDGSYMIKIVPLDNVDRAYFFGDFGHVARLMCNDRFSPYDCTNKFIDALKLYGVRGL